MPFRENLSTEAVGTPPLEAITRKWLMKTQQAGEDIAGAVEFLKCED
jgi:hypothetical protein